jgi:integrase
MPDKSKRRFGRVRELPSGRWQARYKGPDGIDRPAPHTFESKTSAERWLTVTEADVLKGDWTDPDAGRILFGQYAQDWIAERPALRFKTIKLYRYLLRCHLDPAFEARALADIKEPNVRRWRKDLLDGGTSAVTAAKAYRLLKAILNTAVDDGLIKRNPCRIRGGGQEKSPERPVLTIAQVGVLADAAGPRNRALILLAVFGSLRWGELAALCRCDIDVQARTIRVTRQLSEQPGGGFTFGPPKSEAGVRAVAIPEVIMPDLALHVMTYAAPGDDGLLFTSPGGGPLRHTNFRRRVWLPALQKAGLPPIHFHDLRHTGNTLSANAGANLRELMDRMGHSSPRAALIYLHGSDERQQVIAAALSKRAAAELKEAQDNGTLKRSRDGTSGQPCLCRATRAIRWQADPGAQDAQRPSTGSGAAARSSWPPARCGGTGRQTARPPWARPGAPSPPP